MRIFRIVIALFFSGSLLVGCDNTSIQLTGIVQNGLNGEMIEGVRIGLLDGSTYDFTDASGRFSLNMPLESIPVNAFREIDGATYLLPDSIDHPILLTSSVAGYRTMGYRVVSDLTDLTINLIPDPKPWEVVFGAEDRLPQTNLLTHDVQWVNIIDNIRIFYEKRIDRLKPLRSLYWNRDTSSVNAYNRSVTPNRNRFRSILGAVDPREEVSLDTLALVAETPDYKIYKVRWPVFKEVVPGPPLQDWPLLDVPRKVYGEGLLLEPIGESRGYTIAIPDADQNPEDIAGLTERILKESQFARRLVENGFSVIVPVVADRSNRWSRNTNRPSRTWIYSQAHEMGRTIGGYEVQKLEAVVDWFSRLGGSDAKIGIAGYGEGGLLALYTAALDVRIQSSLISGYFAPREEIWKEPIYRNIWGLLKEFGDAELASLIAPRSLVVEYSNVPDYKGPGADGKQIEPPGELWTHSFQEVESEFNRIDSLAGVGFGYRKMVSGPNGKTVAFGSEEAMNFFMNELGLEEPAQLSNEMPLEIRTDSDHRPESAVELDPTSRMERTVEQLVGHTQLLLRESEYRRNEFVKQFEDQEEARKYFKREMIGWLDDDFVPMNVRTKLIEEQNQYVCYDVVMDVLPDVELWGILTIPKYIPSGVKRPVVVLQHGRGGNPSTAMTEGPTYFGIGRKLAERGFIVFTPFGNWTGETRFRWIDRVAKTTKVTLWSTVGREHQQLIRWFKTLPIVDPENIGFYGKSIGGQAASLIASMLPEYAMTINCAYFNEGARKESSIYFSTSFVYHVDSEMPMWNRGHSFEYAEMSNLLIFPRPFMVEHGTKDGIAPPGWVEYEYAKVKKYYTDQGKPELTVLDLHDGGHIINEVVSVPFLVEHLNLESGE